MWRCKSINDIFSSFSTLFRRLKRSLFIPLEINCRKSVYCWKLPADCYAKLEKFWLVFLRLLLQVYIMIATSRRCAQKKTCVKIPFKYLLVTSCTTSSEMTLKISFKVMCLHRRSQNQTNYTTGAQFPSLDTVLIFLLTKLLPEMNPNWL